MSVLVSRNINSEGNKADGRGNESDDDGQFQSLLDYLGLGKYPGLIPILRKLGSGSMTTMIFLSSDIPWIP